MSNLRPLTLNELLFREPIKIERPIELNNEGASLAATSKALPPILGEINLTAAPATSPSASVSLVQFIKRNKSAIILTTGILVLLIVGYQNNKRKTKKNKV